ncbi:hypothetical protein [Bradyrhizobium frederickii]|uniref:hypothetical protein n=1 Tax=Bradyrhizobium frederickii TaxID=2560054 RepID=UPI0014300133|nr:hypothetical protein [Bradyrhizobium frederickii]
MKSYSDSASPNNRAKKHKPERCVTMASDEQKNCSNGDRPIHAVTHLGLQMSSIVQWLL